MRRLTASVTGTAPDVTSPSASSAAGALAPSFTTRGTSVPGDGSLVSVSDGGDVLVGGEDDEGSRVGWVGRTVGVRVGRVGGVLRVGGVFGELAVCVALEGASPPPVSGSGGVSAEGD